MHEGVKQAPMQTFVRENIAKGGQISSKVAEISPSNRYHRAIEM